MQPPPPPAGFRRSAAYGGKSEPGATGKAHKDKEAKEDRAPPEERGSRREEEGAAGSSAADLQRSKEGSSILPGDLSACRMQSSLSQEGKGLGGRAMIPRGARSSPRTWQAMWWLPTTGSAAIIRERSTV